MGSYETLKGIHQDKIRNMFDARTYVKFVTLVERDKQRKLQVRCATYIAERKMAAKVHDSCLMRLTDGHIWASHLNGVDCSGWELFALRSMAEAFKSYVRGYNAARNMFMISEDMFFAPESVSHRHGVFTNSVKVPHLSFCKEDEANATCLSGEGMQYKLLITAEGLGAELFRSGVVPFITGPAGFGILYLIWSD